jgi:hypothetical protein
MSRPESISRLFSAIWRAGGWLWRNLGITRHETIGWSTANSRASAQTPHGLLLRTNPLLLGGSF